MIRAALALVLLTTTSLTCAGEVVRWIDDEGIVQFTDPSYAPHAQLVEIPRANGMSVPEGAPQAREGRASFVKIAKAPKRNKRGWRGYRGRATGPNYNR